METKLASISCLKNLQRKKELLREILYRSKVRIWPVYMKSYTLDENKTIFRDSTIELWTQMCAECLKCVIHEPLNLLIVLMRLYTSDNTRMSKRIYFLQENMIPHWRIEPMNNDRRQIYSKFHIWVCSVNKQDFLRLIIMGSELQTVICNHSN